MTLKEEVRKKVLEEYLNELFEKFDQFKERATKRQKVLLDELDAISKEGDDLIDEITVVKNLYDKLRKLGGTKDQQNVLDPSSFNFFIKKPKTVIEALTLIFKTSASTKFEPVELRDQLEKLREQKLLDTEAENLLWITHSALKTLIKNKVIVKIEEEGKPTYKYNLTIMLPDIIEKMLLGNKEGNNE